MLYPSWSLRKAAYMNPWYALREELSENMNVPRLVEEDLLNCVVERYEKTKDAVEKGCETVMLSGICFTICLIIFTLMMISAIWY